MTKRDEMRPRPKLGRLSAREQRVVALVAEGKTNPEIGQARLLDPDRAEPCLE